MIRTLEQMLDDAGDRARHVIEAAATINADHPSGILAVRAGRVRIACTLEIQSTELALVAFDIIAKGFDPEMMSISFDAYTSALLLNPETGRAWEPGQLAVLSDFGVSMGWSTETLIIHAINRAGDIATLHANYRRDGRRIEWTDEQRGDSTGPAARTLVESMLAPTISHRLASGKARPKRRMQPTREMLDDALADSMRMRLPVMLDLLPR